MQTYGKASKGAANKPDIDVKSSSDVQNTRRTKEECKYAQITNTIGPTTRKTKVRSARNADKTQLSISLRNHQKTQGPDRRTNFYDIANLSGLPTSGRDSARQYDNGAMYT